MPAEELIITVLRDASLFEQHLAPLRRLLQQCVNDDPANSSIGFFAPLSDHEATRYWLELKPSVLLGETPSAVLLVAHSAAGELVATVQVGRYLKETHTYKGEIRKLLVDSRWRRGGYGSQLMQEAERMARDELKLEMLVLDTVTATPAREFYKGTGWTEWGICPLYAKCADGMKADCSFFVKMLSGSENPE